MANPTLDPRIIGPFSEFLALAYVCDIKGSFDEAMLPSLQTEIRRLVEGPGGFMPTHYQSAVTGVNNRDFDIDYALGQIAFGLQRSSSGRLVRMTFLVTGLLNRQPYAAATDNANFKFWDKIEPSSGKKYADLLMDHVMDSNMVSAAVSNMFHASNYDQKRSIETQGRTQEAAPIASVGASQLEGPSMLPLVIDLNSGVLEIDLADNNLSPGKSVGLELPVITADECKQLSFGSDDMSNGGQHIVDYAIQFVDLPADAVVELTNSITRHQWRQFNNSGVSTTAGYTGNTMVYQAFDGPFTDKLGISSWGVPGPAYDTIAKKIPNPEGSVLFGQLATLVAGASVAGHDFEVSFHSSWVAPTGSADAPQPAPQRVNGVAGMIVYRRKNIPGGPFLQVPTAQTKISITNGGGAPITSGKVRIIRLAAQNGRPLANKVLLTNAGQNFITNIGMGLYDNA